MGKITRMTWEEVQKLPGMSDEEAKAFDEFEETFTDPEIPPMTDEELSRAYRLGSDPNNWFKYSKQTITIRLDKHVIDRYKALGKGYQTKMNEDLSKAIDEREKALQNTPLTK